MLRKYNEKKAERTTAVWQYEETFAITKPSVLKLTQL